jgi:hypothetical protein
MAWVLRRRVRSGLRRGTMRREVVAQWPLRHVPRSPYSVEPSPPPSLFGSRYAAQAGIAATLAGDSNSLPSCPCAYAICVPVPLVLTRM